MTERRWQQRQVDAYDDDEPDGRARDLIAALLYRDDELHLGMAVFDLWAAFDELVAERKLDLQGGRAGRGQ